MLRCRTYNVQDVAAKALQKAKKPRTSTDPEKSTPAPKAKAKSTGKQVTDEEDGKEKAAGAKVRKVPGEKKAADLKKALEAADMIQDLCLKDCKPAAAHEPDFSWSEFKQVSFTCNCVM